MTLKLLGKIEQGLTIQEDFHRNYSIKWLVETDDPLDGPQRALNCPGLPAVGSPWKFGNDNEPLAFCWPNWTVSMFSSNNHEPNTLWVVEQPFSTKFNLVTMSAPDNPLTAPPDISGTFVKYQEEKRYDYKGKVLRTMSFEPYRGKAAEFDANRATVSISINYSELGLNVFAFMIDTLNDSPMWGLDMRMIKLSNIRWTRQVWQMGYFYTRHYDFDINFRTFDRNVPQEGIMKLKENGNKNNPKHWELRRDDNKDIVRTPQFYMENGQDWDGVDETQIAKKKIEGYDQSNFFILGVPASF